jgi:uncharacterized protein (DUF1015 family)
VDALFEEVSQQPPQVEVRDEYDVLHRLWPVSDARLVARFEREMADKKLVIADGHHRYETALAYRDECRAAGGSTGRDAPHEKVMMTFFNTCSEGLTILPTHRVVSNLRGFQWTAFREKMAAYFDIGFHPFDKEEERPGASDLLRSHFEEEWREGRSIGVYAGQNSWSDERAFFLFTLKPEVDLAALLPDVSPLQRELDVVLLHRLILDKGLGIKPEAVVKEKNITYEREMEAAIAAVDKGHAQLCFLLNPVRVEQVARIALAGEVMPQKSTDFYPKLLSGLTIYRLDG